MHAPWIRSPSPDPSPPSATAHRRSSRGGSSVGRTTACTRRRSIPRARRCYCLTMLPYPSGDLHIGHWYAMTPSDARARFMRMQRLQRHVPDRLRRLRPAGRECGHQARHPSQGVDVRQHRAHARASCARMGAMCDWRPRGGLVATPSTTTGRSGSSSSSSSTAWPTARSAPVDWCPNCNTTLAREQVLGRGPPLRALRHAGDQEGPGAVVLPHHQLRRRAAGLLEASTGRSACARCRPTGSAAARAPRWSSRRKRATRSEVFTTRPDTLWGATFMVLAPEHPLVERS